MIPKELFAENLETGFPIDGIFYSECIANVMGFFFFFKFKLFKGSKPLRALNRALKGFDLNCYR